MPTNVNAASLPASSRRFRIPRPAFWVVFPLLLGLFSLVLASWNPAYRDLATIEPGAPAVTSP